jgi:hypothetical protein
MDEPDETGCVDTEWRTCDPDAAKTPSVAGPIRAAASKIEQARV